MRVGPPRINLAMFRETAHASSIKLGVLMTLNLPVWHLQGRKCVWKRILLIVLQMISKSLLKPVRTKKHAISFSYHQPLCFPSSQLAWARVKINLGGGCASTGPNDCCNDAKSNWVAFTSKKMRLEQNLIACAQ